jgi:hypothetical protein
MKIPGDYVYSGITAQPRIENEIELFSVSKVANG